MTAESKIPAIFVSTECEKGEDGIYSAGTAAVSNAQGPEKALREQIASKGREDSLGYIARNHSVPVMDKEVDRFLAKMPRDPLILDIGGCWGWHWRRLAESRPDAQVVIVDFVRANLLRAGQLLGPLVGRQITLVEADATALPFPDSKGNESGFDGIWTVQVFQHIPEFELACREAHRLLKKGGRFINYSLQSTPLNRAVHRLLGKNYHEEGMLGEQLYLKRAGDDQRQLIERIFNGGEVTERYSECIFHPDLKLVFTGKPGNVIGRMDARLSDSVWLGRWIGRQRSFEAIKHN